MRDDKPDILARVRERLGAPWTSALVRQGKYVATVPPSPWRGADLTLATIGELRSLDPAARNAAGRSASWRG